MRIITGTARGTKLLTPEGENTRPTSERAKEALFSMIQFDIDGRRALDLFAGSGQLGLEALSRGAASCMFVDASAEAMEIVKQNIEKTHFREKSKTLISDYRSYLRKASGRTAFDLIFLDPPYTSGALEDALRRLYRTELMARGCLLICESEAGEILERGEKLSEMYCALKSGGYGRVHIDILTPSEKYFEETRENERENCGRTGEL